MVIESPVYALVARAAGEQDAPMATIADRPERMPAALETAAGLSGSLGHVARLGDGLVRRTELIARLLQGGDPPLVLLVAPAGYGKTTLLAQWAEEETRPVAWLALGPEYDDAQSLFDAVADALAWLGYNGRENWSGPQFLLVLDDGHAVSSDVLRRVLDPVIASLPHGSQVAVGSRTEPDLALGRLRAERKVFELTARDLAMTAEEASSLLRAVDLEPEPATVEALVDRTEGWPAALYLAALSLQLHGSDEEGAPFSGDDHFVGQFVRDQFLSDLAPSTRRFLRRIAIFDRVSGPLCDSVLELERSDRRLAQLARSNLPLEAIDSGHEWYRLHRLVRESLIGQLRRREPQQVEALQRRASDWYEARGDLDRALDHAAEAGAVSRTGELLWDNLPGYLERGGNDRVRAWLARFSESQIEGSDRLALAAAHSHLASGDVESAMRWRAASEEARANRPRRRSEDRCVEGAEAAIDAWCALGGVAAMAAHAEAASGLLPEHSAWQPALSFLRGTAALLAGDRAAAQRLYVAGSDGMAARTPHTAALCLAQRAAIESDAGAWEEADDLATRALRITEEQGLSDYPASALVFAVYASVAANAARVDEAKEHARRCSALLHNHEELAPWFGAQVRIRLARALTLLADIPDARALLAMASRLARRMPDAVSFTGWLDGAWGQIDTRAETALTGASALTTAELRVLRFLPTHYSFREIADRLHVSSNTVKTQVHAVYQKLGVSSRSEAVKTASRAGLLETS